MRCNRFALVAAIGACATIASAQVPPRAAPVATPAPAAAAVAAADRAADQEAILKLLDTFTRAFNAGDAAAAAATFTDTAIVIDERNERAEGRAAIHDQYAEGFANNPGQTIEIRSDAIRFLGPDTAIEQGRATITPAEGRGAPESSRFTAIYIRKDGQWLQAPPRDQEADDLTPHERLKDLEWLTGDWVNESQNELVVTSCDWDKGGNFLVRDFTMKIRGEEVLSGTQRIGWDPLTRRFKTWVFDTEGGHGEGFFTQNGDQWIVKVEGVRQDGQAVSATNIITRLGKDRLRWQSTDRTLGGRVDPEVDEFTVVRRPPEVGK
jgi:uncharacterized protein (TIGR02246 family)